MISTGQLIRLVKSINTAIAATVFALMAWTLDTGVLVTGSYGDRHLATGRLGRLAHDWQFTEGYSGLRIIRKYKCFTIDPRARRQSSIGSEGTGTWHRHLALWHLVAGT